MSSFDKQKYDNDYAKNNYDRCIFNVPKGQKAIIEAHWKAKGYKSLNSYINDLINADMVEKQEIEKTINNAEINNGIMMKDNNGTINMNQSCRRNTKKGI